jgi:hypothetical protein
MIEATNQWLRDVSDNEAIQRNIKEMMVIHEGGFTIGGAMSIR